ncbi:hypothetical protein Y1Q_0019979 [Alligator mississippiensis]|uniref:Uncharacterized protein n=1 Tax=Alligator mississippiensis TaxID=8496 RepID=A0A151PDX7_ALLMI|nr:hypothetical protein Y1Q_0019979 [Alligator mississippiensis]
MQEDSRSPEKFKVMQNCNPEWSGKTLHVGLSGQPGISSLAAATQTDLTCRHSSSGAKSRTNNVAHMLKIVLLRAH